MDWTRILAYITGSVDQELLLRNEYLAAENRILQGPVEGVHAAVGRRAKLITGVPCATGPTSGVASR